MVSYNGYALNGVTNVEVQIREVEDDSMGRREPTKSKKNDVFDTGTTPTITQAVVGAEVDEVVVVPEASADVEPSLDDTVDGEDPDSD